MQTVIVRGERINVVECKRCGTKFFPAGLLEQHIAAHKEADDDFEKSKKWLAPRLKRLGKNYG